MTIFVYVDCSNLLEDVRDVIYASHGLTLTAGQFCTAFNSLFRTDILPGAYKVSINCDFVREIVEKSKKHHFDVIKSTILALVYKMC